MYNAIQHQAWGFGPGFTAAHFLQPHVRPFAGIDEALEALPPSLSSAAKEIRVIYGTVPAAILANLLAATAFIVAGRCR